jgi:hypothetical protein
MSDKLVSRLNSHSIDMGNQQRELAKIGNELARASNTLAKVSCNMAKTNSITMLLRHMTTNNVINIH